MPIYATANTDQHLDSVQNYQLCDAHKLVTINTQKCDQNMWDSIRIAPITIILAYPLAVLSHAVVTVASLLTSPWRTPYEYSTHA